MKRFGFFVMALSFSLYFFDIDGQNELHSCVFDGGIYQIREN